MSDQDLYIHINYINNTNYFINYAECSIKDLFIPYTLGDGSFFKALYCSVLVLIKNLSFYDSLEIEN